MQRTHVNFPIKKKQKRKEGQLQLSNMKLTAQHFLVKTYH